jgi:hypothetical protein
VVLFWGVKKKVSQMSVFPDTFLEALLDAGSNAPAMCVQEHEAAFKSVLVKHEPSPRAQAPYFCEGEWELFMMSVLFTIVKR